MKYIFMLLQPRLNTYGYVYGQTVILKNCITVMKKHLDHRMHLFIPNVHVVAGSNSTIQKTSRIPRYCAKIITDLPACFIVGTKHSGQQASLGILQTQTRPDHGKQHKGWLIWPYYIIPVTRHPGFMIITLFFSLSVLFSVSGGLAIADLPWMLDLWSSC
jgi:hypothetical protein